MQSEVFRSGDLDVGGAEFLAEGAVAAGGGEVTLGVESDEGGVADGAGGEVRSWAFTAEVVL